MISKSPNWRRFCSPRVPCQRQCFSTEVADIHTEFVLRNWSPLFISFFFSVCFPECIVAIKIKENNALQRCALFHSIIYFFYLFDCGLRWLVASVEKATCSAISRFTLTTNWVGVRTIKEEKESGFLQVLVKGVGRLLLNLDNWLQPCLNCAIF